MVALGKQLVGIVTDRDLTVRVLGGDLPSKTQVVEVMSGETICCAPDDDIKEVLRIMRLHQVRRTPVVSKGRVVGIISLCDIAIRATDYDEIEMTSLIAPIVQAADAISGARPGARREALDAYIKRLEKLEEVAGSFNGVERVYAIQAGREIRVLVNHDLVSDTHAEQLAGDISNRIQREMQYPGQIKVTVIREVRSVAYAK